MFSSGFVAKTLINTTKKSKSTLSTQSRHSLSSINAKLGQFSLYLNTNRSIAFRAIQDLKHSKTTPLQKPYSTIATQMKAKKLAPVNSTFDSEMHIEVNHYDELIRSLPEQDRADVMAELESNIVVRYAKLLYSQLAANETVGLNLSESRTLFLAALRNLKDGKIAVAQLASMHILDSAIRTLCTNPMAYLIHRFVVNGKVHQSMNVAPLPHIVGMPSSFKMCSYNAHMPPKEGMSVSELPHRMQKPLMQRFFNFTESEWEFFCKEMHETPLSEQKFSVLNAPEEGCYSSIISNIQKILQCMHTLDRLVDSDEGMIIENIMLVPSFSMFQAAINAKAHTLGRTPVQLIPTYGYSEPQRYTELKTAGKLAFAMYMPEVNFSERYKVDAGGFRTSIDGHTAETAFAGAIHDVYHAMREMSMSENIAKARMRLVSIAKNHPYNNHKDNSRPVDVILVDGELIYSYPPSLDTMFNPEYRSPQAEKFGEIFYASSLKPALHDNLKYAFIEDMVIHETLWKNQFNISKSDLRKEDENIFDEIKSQRMQSVDAVRFDSTHAITRIGLLAKNKCVVSNTSSLHSLSRSILSKNRRY